MKKLFKNGLFILLISLLFLTGCGVKDGDKDVHYKPSEFKHNVAISNASRAIDDVDREIISMGAETSADIVYETYNNSIATLNEHLKTLESTKKQLSEDKDLTNSELSRWNADYDSLIKGVKNKIKDVETKKANFLK